MLSAARAFQPLARARSPSRRKVCAGTWRTGASTRSAASGAASSRKRGNAAPRVRPPRAVLSNRERVSWDIGCRPVAQTPSARTPGKAAGGPGADEARPGERGQAEEGCQSVGVRRSLRLGCWSRSSRRSPVQSSSRRPLRAGASGWPAQRRARLGAGPHPTRRRAAWPGEHGEDPPVARDTPMHQPSSPPPLLSISVRHFRLPFRRQSCTIRKPWCSHRSTSASTMACSWSVLCSITGATE